MPAWRDKESMPQDVNEALAFGRLRLPSRMRLAEAYVPWQEYGKTFNPEEGLRKGTIFPELYRPYVENSYYRQEGGR
ncbi:MAG: hypothetical protein PWP65_1515 [Clostridia bacterium]|nr:hypothetical protein [Clostridia bacterium]